MESAADGASPPRRRATEHRDNKRDQRQIDKADDDASPPRRRATEHRDNKRDQRKIDKADDDASPPRRRATEHRDNKRDHRQIDKADDDASPPHRRATEHRDNKRDQRQVDKADDDASPPRRRPAETLSRDQTLKDSKKSQIDKYKPVKQSEYSSYGPSSSSQTWGIAEIEKQHDLDAADENIDNDEEFQPNFGLSGALAKDERTGNLKNGVLLQYTESLDAMLSDKKWRIYTFKGDENINILHLHRNSYYLFGRDERVADIHLAHPSCSKQHAVLQFRCIKKKDVTGQFSEVIKPYIIDLNSANKTLLNNQVIEEARYYEILSGDSLKFGGSTREYIVLLEDAI